MFVVVFLGMYDDWIAFGPIAQLEIAQDKNSHYRNERERQTRGWGGSGGRGGGWNGEDVRALGRGWRQAALRWKPDQTLCLSEQLL